MDEARQANNDLTTEAHFSHAPRLKRMRQLSKLLDGAIVIPGTKQRIGLDPILGLIPGGGSSVRLPRKIGPTRAKYLMYTGEFLPARELLAWGLVNEVVADGELLTAAEKLVGKLANKSPVGLEKMKYLVDDGLNQTADTALRLELLAFDLHMNSEDVKEGLAAFEQKRTPQFTGR